MTERTQKYANSGPREWIPFEFRPVGLPIYVKWEHGQMGEAYHDGLLLHLNRRSPEGYLLGSRAEDSTPTHWSPHPEVPSEQYADAIAKAAAADAGKQPSGGFR